MAPGIIIQWGYSQSSSKWSIWPLPPLSLFPPFEPQLHKLADERIVWRRSLIEYLCLMLDIGSYSCAFNFSGNKKRNHSNRTSRAARHENEKSSIGGKLSRPHFPSIGHLCFSRVSSHRRHSFLRLQLQLDENTGTLQFCPACLYRHGCFQRG